MGNSINEEFLKGLISRIRNPNPMSDREKENIVYQVYYRVRSYYDYRKGDERIYFLKSLENELKKHGSHIAPMKYVSEQMEKRKDIFG